MRNLLSILLAISLSWVTTSYACQMDQQALVRAFCCCKDKDKHEAKPTAELDQAHASAAEESSCCDVTASASIDQHQPAVTPASPALDMPVAVLAPTVPWTISEQVASYISLPPPARGPPGAGTRTYLATSRLRL